jgi:DNA-binding MarR family transcriptional regulator
VKIPDAERRTARITLACNIYQARLDRVLFFRQSLFGDYGWDALLAIYVFGAAGYTLSAGELCKATCDTSLTSALRMQRRLSDLKLVRRVTDPNDARRVLIELTSEGQKKLEDYLDHILDRHLAPAHSDMPPPYVLLDRLRETVTGG